MDPKSKNQQNVAMGYPTMTGYPVPPCQGYLNPYPNYPSMADSNKFANYNTGAPSYYNHQLYYSPEEGEENTGAKFVRVMTGLMVVSIGFICAITLVMYILFGTEIPDFRVASLEVGTPDITSGTTLMASFKANVTVKNLNTKLQIEFADVRSKILYDDDLLATGQEDGLLLDPNQEKILHAKLATNGMPQAEGKYWVMQKLDADRGAGVVNLSLRFTLDATFKSGSWWKKQILNVYCEDLTIKFSNSTGPGKWEDSQKDDCLVLG